MEATLEQILKEIRNLQWKLQQIEQKIDRLTNDVRQIKRSTR